MAVRGGLLGGLLQAAAGLRWVSARAALAAQDVAMGGTALLGAVAPRFGVFGSARAIPSPPLRLASLAGRHVTARQCTY